MRKYRWALFLAKSTAIMQWVSLGHLPPARHEGKLREGVKHQTYSPPNFKNWSPAANGEIFRNPGSISRKFSQPYRGILDSLSKLPKFIIWVCSRATDEKRICSSDDFGFLGHYWYKNEKTQSSILSNLGIPRKFVFERSCGRERHDEFSSFDDEYLSHVDTNYQVQLYIQARRIA